MIREVLMFWRSLDNTRDLGRLGIVLHTSCVNYSVQELNELWELSRNWILPGNVYMELQLLRRSELFGKKADFLLERGREYPTRMNGRNWDLESFYRDCAEPISPRSVWRGDLLFLFCDLAKQDEFVRRVRPEKGLYILLCDSWSPSRCNADGHWTAVRSLSGDAADTKRRVAQLTPFVKTPAFDDKNDAEIEFRTDSGEKIPRSEFRAVGESGKSGSYAKLYICGRFPEKYIKGYKKNLAADGSRVEKLQNLRQVGNIPQFQKMPLALPTELLYDNRERCRGYVMKKCAGDKLKFMLDRGDPRLADGASFQRILANLFLLILELHSFHILINDLSYNNILIDEDNRVSLVDCDSFQIMRYPGGPMTDYYRHPDLKIERDDLDLKDPAHEYFALSALLYQILVGVDNPVCRKRTEEADLNWENAKFPLDVQRIVIDKGVRLQVDQDVRENWNSLPDAARRLFADEFHFRRTASVGAWLRALNMIK